MFRSLTLSPLNSVLQQAHQMARPAGSGRRGCADLAARREKPDLAPRDYVLPLDVDAEEDFRVVAEPGRALRKAGCGLPSMERAELY